MNPVAESVGAPRTALVNLFPADIVLQRAANRTKRMLGFVLIAFVAVLAAAWVLMFTARQAAEDDLDSVTALTPVKQAELAKYDYLPALEAQLQNSRNARAWAGIVDVAWADQLASLTATIPANVRLNTLAVTPSTPVAPFATGNSVFSRIDIGSIAFTGESSTPVDTAALKEAIDALPGFRDATVDSVAIADGDEAVWWTYSGSARVTFDALSNRTTTTQEIVAVEPTAEATTDEEG